MFSPTVPTLDINKMGVSPSWNALRRSVRTAGLREPWMTMCWNPSNSNACGKESVWTLCQDICLAGRKPLTAVMIQKSDGNAEYTMILSGAAPGTTFHVDAASSSGGRTWPSMMMAGGAQVRPTWYDSSASSALILVDGLSSYWKSSGDSSYPATLSEQWWRRAWRMPM